MEKSFHNESINDIIEFLTEYYGSFIIEDSLFQSLRNFIKSIVGELHRKYVFECRQTSNSLSCQKEVERFLSELLRVFYAASNEPVRLGAFRILFNEVHKRVHGGLLFKSTRGIDLALHGVLREKLTVLLSEGWSLTESYHVGIDYVSLIEYPTLDQKRRVIVPLFVIAKSRHEEIREIRIREAVNKALQQRVESNNVMQALQSIPRFTRIVLTRTIYDEEQARASCVIGRHQDIPVYGDIACGIIGLVFKDIPGIYEEIVSNEKLANLTIGDWIKALLGLAIPITQVIVASASSPPKAPGDGGMAINNIVNRIRQEALRRVGAEVKKQICVARSYVMRLEPELKQKLTKIINRYRSYEGMGTRIRVTY